MLDREARAKINRENAQKSTGPKTAAGKAISRTNALKHGLTSTTIDPICAPGEPEGAYQERLNFWLDDMQPQNAFELSMVKRACRCDWKLDRCARYEDAAAYVRSIKDMDGVRIPGIEDKSNRERARKLGALLMFAIQTRYERKDFGPPQLKDGLRPLRTTPPTATPMPWPYLQKRVSNGSSIHGKTSFPIFPVPTGRRSRASRPRSCGVPPIVPCDCSASRPETPFPNKTCTKPDSPRSSASREFTSLSATATRRPRRFRPQPLRRRAWTRSCSTVTRSPPEPRGCIMLSTPLCRPPQESRAVFPPPTPHQTGPFAGFCAPRNPRKSKPIVLGPRIRKRTPGHARGFEHQL